MPIMPTQKNKITWVVRRYNYETGKHEIINVFTSKEECHKFTYSCRKNVIETKEPFNFSYEGLKDFRPDLHHEKLMEEWGYNDINK